MTVVVVVVSPPVPDVVTVYPLPVVAVASTPPTMEVLTVSIYNN